NKNTKARAEYKLLQKSNHNARKLLQDTLLYTNDYRKNIVLKAILLLYTTTKDKKKVFEKKLKGLGFLITETKTPLTVLKIEDAIYMTKLLENQGPHKEIFKQTIAKPHEPVNIQILKLLKEFKYK
ncbi:19503_t:CDS:2, partial [Dentiscutata erythropus]